MSSLKLEDIDDLTAVRSPASRLARVHISPDRVEIVLTRTDYVWVEDTLETIRAMDHLPTVVVACPE